MPQRPNVEGCVLAADEFLSNLSRELSGDNELETAEKPDTTSQSGRQLNRHMGRRIDSRQPKSRTPPEWETNELFYGETQELETARKADTTRQTGRLINRYMGRQGGK